MSRRYFFDGAMDNHSEASTAPQPDDAVPTIPLWSLGRAKSRDESVTPERFDHEALHDGPLPDAND